MSRAETPAPMESRSDISAFADQERCFATRVPMLPPRHPAIRPGPFGETTTARRPSGDDDEPGTSETSNPPYAAAAPPSKCLRCMTSEEVSKPVGPVADRADRKPAV
ncbi:hypothetical protein HPB50_018255 [Hyalomma asiaticum]|uniref:Uncharacterized protein n=1 Tax=Hyalomma asiaticum TaxID=266040 RepID=A0ACB7SIB6_HYAAI|nr:hypothetical protein HPB50_018255 [Hyalomma asiaticum]